MDPGFSDAHRLFRHISDNGCGLLVPCLHVRRSIRVHDGRPSSELAALYFSIALLLMAAGPGRFSLDRKFSGPR